MKNSERQRLRKLKIIGRVDWFRRPMGSTLRKRPGAAMRLRFRAADSAGLARVRIISNGRLIHETLSDGKTLVEGSLSVKAGRKPAYYRLESVSVDDMRAFSTPIYVEVNK